ncbi:MAG: hypothetical protein OWU84_07045 [Firmicutes bacterium]|nr:hypothetical protein [Bacillota bacterium]
MAAQPALDTVAIVVPRQDDAPGCTALVTLRSARVTLRPLRRIPGNATRQHAAPGLDGAFDLADREPRRRGEGARYYAYRWRAERPHYGLKSSGLGENLR